MKHIIFALLAVALLSGCASEQVPEPLGSSSSQSTLVGTDFPSLELAEYGTSAVTISDELVRGKVINLWASWCEPCKREFPLMAQSQFASQIIAINVNDLSQSQAGKSAADALVALGDQALSVWIDTKNEFKSSLSIVGLPMSFAVNSEGVIVDAVIGELQEDSLARLVKAATE